MGPSSKGKPTDPKLREKVKEEVKNKPNSDGGGKGQWSAWKAAQLSKEYEARGGGYENEGGSKNEPKKGTPEPKSDKKKEKDEEKEDSSKDKKEEKEASTEKSDKENQGPKKQEKANEKKPRKEQKAKSEPREGTRKSSRQAEKRKAD